MDIVIVIVTDLKELMMTKYIYKYDKNTHQYKVIRYDIDTPWFKSLRDCKLSWKLLYGLHHAVIERS